VRLLADQADAVAQALVGQFAAQRVVGALLLFDLLQRRAQQRLLTAFLGRVVPDAAQQPHAVCIGRRGQAQDAEVAAAAVPVVPVFAEQRLALRQGGVVCGAQRADDAAVEQLGVGAPQHLRRRAADDSGHAVIDMQVAATGAVLHGQQIATLGQHSRQQRAQHSLQWRWAG